MDRTNTSPRFDRRTMLRGTGLAAAGSAAFMLAGCGDDDDSTATSASPFAASSTTTSGASPAASAPKHGGTLRFPLWGDASVDPATLYPFENVGYIEQTAAAPHYSRLLRNVVGPGIGIADHTKLEGDIATGLPEQPDPLTYIFTFRPDLRWHDKAPLNGRAATAGDFVRTYDAFLARSQGAANWKTFVDRMEARDDSHLVVTLKSPYVPFLTTHASAPDSLWFVPVETIDNDQVRTDPVGTGPWVFREWQNGVALRWDRNPAYVDQPRPYFDHLEATVSKDQQRILAGLKSGDLDWSLLSVSLRDEVKRTLDPAGHEISMPAFNLGAFFFNYDIAPFGDPRVRRALSSALDRDGYLGIQDKTGKGDWFSFIPPGLEPYYISPKSSDFGPNAKNFQRNVKDATDLLSAAGYGDGLTFTLNCSPDYGEAFRQMFEMFSSSLAEAGMTVELNFQPLTTYRQTSFAMKFTEGAAAGPLAGSPRDPDSVFSSLFASDSGLRKWAGTPPVELAELDTRIAKQRTITSLDERVAYIKEMQRWMGGWMPTVPYHANSSYGWAQPWVSGFQFKAGYAYISDVLSRWSFTEDRLKKS